MRKSPEGVRRLELVRSHVPELDQAAQQALCHELFALADDVVSWFDAQQHTTSRARDVSGACITLIAGASVLGDCVSPDDTSAPASRVSHACVTIFASAAIVAGSTVSAVAMPPLAQQPTPARSLGGSSGWNTPRVPPDPADLNERLGATHDRSPIFARWKASERFIASAGMTG